MTGQLTMEGAPGTRVRLNGREYLYFAGTSYFQLHNHPEVIRTAEEALQTYGIGCATSRSLTGTTPDQLMLEQEIAEYFGTEDAAYLPSGYLSNMAGLSGLDGYRPFHKIFLDECAHYSLKEAALATGKQVISFSHLQPETLAEELHRHLSGNEVPLVASDGLFPISASLAPARAYLELVDEYAGMLWLDDAHGVGILGENGRGCTEELGIDPDQIYFGATLSKAFGSYGGFIPGNRDFISHVKKTGAFTGSNSPLSPAVAAGRKGLSLIANDPGKRTRLRENAIYLKQGLAELGLDVQTDPIPIASFNLGDAENMRSVQQALMSDGIYIQYTQYKGAGAEGVLRIVVSSEHEQADMDRLLDALGKRLLV